MTIILLQIVIHSDNDEFPKLELTTFGTRQLFEKLKKVLLWLYSRCLVMLPPARNHHVLLFIGLDASKNSYCCPSWQQRSSHAHIRPEYPVQRSWRSIQFMTATGLHMQRGVGWNCDRCLYVLQGASQQTMPANEPQWGLVTSDAEAKDMGRTSGGLL